MNKNIYLILLFSFLHQFSLAQDISLEGTIWIDSDGNSLYDGENGINDLKIYLIKADANETLDSTFTINANFNFPSKENIIIPPGMYYLEIAADEFTVGGDLQSIASCSGSNDANNEVDLDDNGLDMIPIQSTGFSLNSGHYEHIDMCLNAYCSEPNPLALGSCDEITEFDLLCEISIIGTFCNSMSTINSSGSQPAPLCSDGGSAGNISWFAFVAFDGDYSIVISPNACKGSTTGEEGIQVGIYTDCTFQESAFCLPSCSEDPITIDSDILTPGQKYYLFIDGCGSSVCSYAIDIEGTPSPPNIQVGELCILDDGMSICEDSTIKTGEQIVFQVDNLEPIFDYNWSITTLSGGPYAGDASPITEESNIELAFDNEGIYSVCLTHISTDCAQFDWNGSACRTVIIQNTVSTQDELVYDIKINPNPVSEYLTIDGDFDIVDASYRIYAVDGELMKNGTLDESKKIQLERLAAGLYVIVVRDNTSSQKWVKRFVKQ